VKGNLIMKEKHIVLRIPGAAAATRDAFRGGASVLAGPASADVIVQVEEIDTREVRRLNRDVGVVAVAPAMPMRLIEPRDVHDASPEDTGDMAWGIRAVKADTSPFTGAGITVAVLDTGIDPGHAAFTGVELMRRNFTEEGDDDLHGHGTHCAGTIFGRRTSGARIGVAPGVTRVLIGKVLGKGGGSSEQIASAIQWACDNGAHVISMSLGIDFPGLVRRLIDEVGMPPELATSKALDDYRTNLMLFERLATLMRARAQPTIIVAAAGNESRRDVDGHFEIGVSPPAVAEGIISVAALGTGPDGLSVAPFSNTGALVSGPGVGVISAKRGGGLATMSGTSMATPHVAGVAALWAERIRDVGLLTSSQLVAKVVGMAHVDGMKAGFDPTDIGAGLVIAPQS
jgi:subtilisin family serine protease